MKKLIILTLIFVQFQIINISAQCTLDLLFPVSTGMNHFQAINQLNLQENIYSIGKDKGYWWKDEYLNGDSVFKSIIRYKLLTNSCIKGSYNNITLLYFADRELYKMELSIYFKPKDLNKCLEKYNLLYELVKKKFPYKKDFIVKNSKINEQIGEGSSFYKSKEEINKQKFESFSLKYSIDYNFIYTNKIDSYVLKLKYVDLKNTKLDRRGY